MVIVDEYRKAKKLASKQCREALFAGKTMYPEVLSERLEDEETAGERRIGVMEIPLNLIVGTREAGRSNAFSNGFLPLLDEDSEFAAKWCSLFKIQMDEGFRDPVLVYEYKNFFYVQEGNKRVSIMKYLGSTTILANVIRILPKKDDSPEITAYYEFVDFFEKTKMWSIILSNPGDYGKLLKSMGKTWDDELTREEQYGLSIVFHRFSRIYETFTKNPEARQIGAAFLRWLEIFSYEEIKEESAKEFKRGILSAKTEINPSILNEKIEHVLEPVEEEAQVPFSSWLGFYEKNVKVAFVYEGKFNATEWNSFHEVGRRSLQLHFRDNVETSIYEAYNGEDDFADVLEKAVADGNTVIFTTGALLMNASVKVALKYPKIRFFNCSLNFPFKSVRTYMIRTFEVKFLLGLIAGVISKTDEIIYEEDYPMYGAIANVNAFALGVQMVRPTAKVKLYWTGTKGNDVTREEYPDGVISSGRMNSYNEDDASYGLYVKNDGKDTVAAVAFMDWGEFYIKILQFIIEGKWKSTPAKGQKSMNYWWGLSADVLDVICSDVLSTSVKRLIAQFKNDIATGEFYPFEGVIVDQNGQIHGQEGKVFPIEDIISMDWLCENIVGTIPVFSELNDEAMDLLELQGIEAQSVETVEEK